MRVGKRRERRRRERSEGPEEGLAIFGIFLNVQGTEASKEREGRERGSVFVSGKKGGRGSIYKEILKGRIISMIK